MVLRCHHLGVRLFYYYFDLLEGEGYGDMNG